jgi:hypothetical protein
LVHRRPGLATRGNLGSAFDRRATRHSPCLPSRPLTCWSGLVSLPPFRQHPTDISMPAVVGSSGSRSSQLAHCRRSKPSAGRFS